MALNEPQRDRPQPPGSEERRRLDDELIGLDRDDPEVQAFAEHLDRAHRQRPGFTIEGYLSDVTDFAESANRAQGLRRTAAVLGAVLVLIWVIAEAVAFIVGA